MEDKVKRLIAVGASVGANCHPCVEFHIGKALEMGIDKAEISEAVAMAKAVRKGAAASLDTLVLKLLDGEKPEECGDKKSSCCCS
jgi:AhpD family alkylhydroperoxidase